MHYCQSSAPNDQLRCILSVGSDRGNPNGVVRLKGESDPEYVVRQTRLRNEAKQRMASLVAAWPHGRTSIAVQQK